jgi:hypothetical protein
MKIHAVHQAKQVNLRNGYRRFNTISKFAPITVYTQALMVQNSQNKKSQTIPQSRIHSSHVIRSQHNKIRI